MNFFHRGWPFKALISCIAGLSGGGESKGEPHNRFGLRDLRRPPEPPVGGPQEQPPHQSPQEQPQGRRF